MRNLIFYLKIFDFFLHVDKGELSGKMHRQIDELHKVVIVITTDTDMHSKVNQLHGYINIIFAKMC